MISLCLFSIPVFSSDLNEQLETIQKEKQKIQNYIGGGQGSPELNDELRRLSDSESNLKSQILEASNAESIAKAEAIAKEKLKKKRKAKVTKNRAKKSKRVSSTKRERYTKPFYYFDKSLSLEDQYEVVSADLQREEQALISFKESIKRGIASSYLERPMRMVEEKIILIKNELSKLEEKRGPASADASGPQIKFGAMLDFYYLHSPGRSQEGTAIPNRNYDRKNNDFTMNLFELNVAASFNKMSVYADLDFGDFADQNQGHDGDGINHNIGQAYLTYDFADNLSLSAGKMYTHVGYEVAKAQENWNYSRAFTFSLAGPFWHEGVALRYSHDKGFNAGAFVYDNSDSSAENNSDKTYGTQLGYSNDRFHFLFNFITGAEGMDRGKTKTIYEFNTQYALTDSFSLALNGVFGSDEAAVAPLTGTANVDKKWSTFVLYGNWVLNKKWSFTPRLELFNDDTKNGAIADHIFINSAEDLKADDMKSYTLTTTYHANDYSQLRFEYRTDKASSAIWTDGDGEAKDSLTTLSLSWLLTI